jgi:hypothetical protein
VAQPMRDAGAEFRVDGHYGGITALRGHDTNCLIYRLARRSRCADIARQPCRRHIADMPPSSFSSDPVMKPLSSEAR